MDFTDSAIVCAIFLSFHILFVPLHFNFENGGELPPLFDVNKLPTKMKKKHIMWSMKYAE